MNDEKIKRKDFLAVKDLLRDEIAEIAAQIRDWVSRPKAIPGHIVNGSLSEVQECKQCAEDVSGMYHVNFHPGSSLSLARLREVRDKLRSHLNTLEGVK